MVQNQFRLQNKNTTKRMLYFLCFGIGALVALFSHWAKAEVLFEGYSKILNGGVHCGYIVNRYEFDPKKKQFISISFLKTNQLGGNITESTHAVASQDMRPISYAYTSVNGSQVKTIDAKFDRNKMTATVQDGKNQRKITKDIPKGVFLSTFLTYVMLKSPSGMKAETKYDYKAIAEEDAAIVEGVAFVKSVENYNGLKAFRVLNDFKSTKFISYVSEKGEVFSTKSPAEGIGTELVPTATLATAQFGVPTELLAKLFGQVPTGVKNDISKRAQEAPPSTAVLPTEGAVEDKPTPGKSFGVPPNKGIHIKAVPAPTTTIIEN